CRGSDGGLADRVEPVRRLHGEILELRQDVRRPRIDRRGSALALAELAPPTRWSRSGRRRRARLEDERRLTRSPLLPRSAGDPGRCTFALGAVRELNPAAAVDADQVEVGIAGVAGGVDDGACRG